MIIGVYGTLGAFGVLLLLLLLALVVSFKGYPLCPVGMFSFILVGLV